MSFHSFHSLQTLQTFRMLRGLQGLRSRRRARRALRSGPSGWAAFLAAVPVLLVTGCVGPGSKEAPESVWRSYLEPRPDPLPDAPRLSVGPFQLVPDDRWAVGTALTAGEGLQDLVGTELLRRQDVHFVERRRFTRAVERERRGLPRPPGAPPIGRSPGAELVLFGNWLPAGGDSAALRLRVTDVETGVVLHAWSVTTPRDADPVSLARTATGGLLAVLDSLGRRPEWSDPLAGGDPPPSPPSFRRIGVPPEAVEAYFRGADAEDRYDWEGALRAYRTALELAGPGFWEPRVALARAARLRAGGSLGSGP